MYKTEQKRPLEQWGQCLFLEHQPDGGYEQNERQGVIPPEAFGLEKQRAEQHKNHQSNDLLNDFQLHERERSAVFLKPDAVCRHLKTIFEECDAPAKKNDTDEGQGMKPRNVFHPQMSIPRKSHENVGRNEQKNGIKSCHN